MQTDERDEPGVDQPLVAALAHRLGERAAEQDQHDRDQAGADDERRQPG